MTDFTVPDEIRQVTESLLAFVDREVLPLEAKHHDLVHDPREHFLPDGRYAPELLALRAEVRERSARAGFYTLFGSEELGGAGLGALAAAHIKEALYRHVGPARALVDDVVIPSPFTNGLTPILEHVRPEVRARYLADIAEGRTTLCFGLSEPDAGSDVYAIKTRATRTAGGWTINGTKQWITNAPYADLAMIFAVTDPEAARNRSGGITCFLVDTTDPGFEVTSVIPLMGHLGSDTGIISLQDVTVPDEQVIGEVGGGLRLALGGIGLGRLTMSANCVGLARWALELAVSYAKTRVTFGRPIAEHQAVQTLLADMAIDIYAARNMVAHAAWLVDGGTFPVKESSMTKAYCTEMLFRVMDKAIQVHGAMGLTNEVRLEEGLRYARLYRIPDGTGEIQRRTVAKRLINGDLSF